jgi:LytS/YehU family sensor histidine kinase
VDEVAVREEWGFVRGYLELERLRLGERLQSSCTVAEDALDATVPSFALQTLVENAVRHGVAPRAGGGRLAIAVRRGDGIVRLEVENDAPPGAAVPREGRGIGLRLLRERLAALYDQGALLSLEASGGVFRAALEVPQRAAAETE